MTVPLIAVITRTQNRPLALRRALKSVGDAAGVLGESLVQVVVNDGGDRAAVEEAVQQVQHRVQTEHLVKPVGRGAAANVGLARSSSTLVVFHDDDDTWHPEFLHAAVKAWRGSGRRGALSWAEYVIERETAQSYETLRVEPFFPQLEAVSLADIAEGNCLVNHALLLERAAVDEVGGYDEGLALYEDWDFNLRFFSRFDVAYVPQRLARYHQREHGAASFRAEVGAGPAARALLVNRWLRMPGSVGLLMAMGPSLQAMRGQRERLDKVLNAIHKLGSLLPKRFLENVKAKL